MAIRLQQVLVDAPGEKTPGARRRAACPRPPRVRPQEPGAAAHAGRLPSPGFCAQTRGRSASALMRRRSGRPG